MLSSFFQLRRGVEIEASYVGTGIWSNFSSLDAIISSLHVDINELVFLPQ